MSRTWVNALRIAFLSMSLVLALGAGPTTATALAKESAGIVFIGKKTEKSNVELWGAKADGSEPFAIRKTALGETTLPKFSEPQLSPDGKSVAVVWNNSIGVVSVETGVLTTVYDGSSKTGASAGRARWSPDGKRLIFVADVKVETPETIRGHVYTVNADGTDLQQITIEFPYFYEDTRVRDPSYSPSGRRIVFAGFPDNAKQGHIYVARADGSKAQPVYVDPMEHSITTSLRSLSFSPDGSSILFVRAGDTYPLEVHLIPAGGGADTQITNETDDPGSNEDPTWLPNGATIAYSSSSGHIKVVDTAGENREALLSGFASDSQPSYRQPEYSEVLENEELLEEYRPEFVYDSQESYRTDSPAEMTDLWGSDSGLWNEGENEYTNTLWSGAGEESQEIARSSPQLEPGQFELTLSGLGSSYPSELESTEDDWIDERNDHYAEDAQELEGRPGYVNRDYGHVVADSEGNVWLEYWLFYYYDDSSYLGLSTGSHEGDWEMMMVKLNQARNPVEVVYAQHEDGSHCAWNETETWEGRPVAYVAVGTHATYPRPGTWALPSGVPGGFDHNDGEGGFATPAVERIGDADPSWVGWPGRWGGTTPGILPGEATSPSGPAQHSQWSDPAGFAEEVAECEERYEPPEEEFERGTTPRSRATATGTPTPAIVSAVHKGNHVVVSYRLPASVDLEHASMILSVNPAGGRPAPLSEGVRHLRRRGTVHLPFEIGPNHEGVVLSSLLEGPGRSAVAIAPLE